MRTRAQKAERALLGAGLLGAVVDGIVADDLSSTEHRMVWSAIQAVAATGGVPDALTVADKLAGELDHVGGTEYLAKLIEQTPGTPNVAAYAQIVREAADRRRLADIGRRLVSDAASDPDLRRLVEDHKRAVAEVAPIDTPARTNNPLAWMEGSELTADEAEQISDPAWAEPGLFAEGHVIAVVAKPNGGKTTICFHIACKLAGKYTVVYVDADTNPSDAKRKLLLAKQHGVRYLTPDLKVGKSMRDVVAELDKLAATDIDLTGHVWFFDTLKKMANVIHKDSLKHVLGLMRKLSGRGMTCVLLCHTNKYKNADGEYQFEGTGDLESDVDELIYFEPRDNDDGTLTVSTRCQKRRAEIAARTWDIHADRTVTARDHYVDVVAEAKLKEIEDEDAVAIDAVRDCLAEGPKRQTEIVKHCSPYGVTEKRLRKVLRRYRGKHWLESPLGKDNAKEYRLIPRLNS